MVMAEGRAAPLWAPSRVVNMAPLRGDVQVIEDARGHQLRFARGADLLLFVLTLARVDPGRAIRFADSASLHARGGDILLHLGADA
jgi:hypothetical protein